MNWHVPSKELTWIERKAVLTQARKGGEENEGRQEKFWGGKEWGWKIPHNTYILWKTKSDLQWKKEMGVGFHCSLKMQSGVKKWNKKEKDLPKTASPCWCCQDSEVKRHLSFQTLSFSSVAGWLGRGSWESMTLTTRLTREDKWKAEEMGRKGQPPSFSKSFKH